MWDWDNEIFDEMELTSRQGEVLKLKRKGLTSRAMAKELGLGKTTINDHLQNIKKKANARFYHPEIGLTVPMPAGMTATKATIQVKDGKVFQYWAKTELDKQIDLIQTAITAFVEPIPSLPVQSYTVENYDTDVIPWFQIGDAHIGMIAHAVEVGQEFNLKIAEQELCLAIDRLVERTPACERCVINDLGDFSHYENISGTTAHSGHALDTDGKLAMMVKVYARVYRYIIERCAQRFKHVDVIINQGNHSRALDLTAQVWLTMLYEDNPRVTILENANVFIPYRMGNTLVMVHHSDKCKPVKLADVMATDYAQDFGETIYHYIDIGHIHHRSVSKELGTCMVESWNQIAGADAYAHEHGWRSRSFLTVVDRSKTYGEIGRRTVTREEVKDCLGGHEPGTTAKVRRSVYTV